MDLELAAKTTVITGRSVVIGLGAAPEGAHVVLAAQTRERVEREAHAPIRRSGLSRG